MIEKLRTQNPEIKFLSLKDKCPLFEAVEGDFSKVSALSQKLELKSSNSYIPNDVENQSTKIVKEVESEVFGELPVQAGWCFGGQTAMDGMEWHKTSEVVVACSDAVLLLGDYADVVNDTYDSSNAIALYIKCGEAVEIKPMTLHYAPLPVQEFFKVAIILPLNTNLPLEGGIKGAKRAVNKWLLVHAENIDGIKCGEKVGVIGKNIRLKK